MWRTASDGSTCSSLNAAFCPIVSKYGSTERNYFKISVILQGFLKISNYLNAFSGKGSRDEASEGLKQCETPS